MPGGRPPAKPVSLSHGKLRDLLESRYRLYANPEFVGSDPVSIPHLFSQRRDIEIAGLLTALLSWGNRKTILRNARELMRRMDDDPSRFILSSSPNEIAAVRDFVHRTFNGNDCETLILALRTIYMEYDSLEPLFPVRDKGSAAGITVFRETVLHFPHEGRFEKHLPDPMKGSASKRIHMFLRWMVRPAKEGIDFGIWNSIPASSLLCPLDVHSGNTARRLGLLQRKTNDWQAVVELTDNLKKFDPLDPARFDFALFGTGASGEK